MQGLNIAQNNEYETFQAGWIVKEAQVKPFTRSMNGWTKEFLGAPTLEWLEN